VIAQLNYPQVWMLILAWFVTDLATPLVVRLSRRVGALDRPHTYKTHTEPVALLGGVAVFVGFAVALFSILRFPNWAQHQDVFAIVGGGFVVLALGLVDGFRPLWAPAKLAVLLAVTWGLSHFNVRISLTGLPLLDLGLTLLWIAGVSSAMNSLDNMDGAAAGTAAIAAFWTFHVAWYSEPWGQARVSYVAIALVGACLGFLRYNFLARPASIFLGDNGSLVLGFLLGALTVHAGWAREDRLKAILVPCAILVVPLYDITLSTILRIRRGVVRGPIEAIVYCGRDHLSHRLVALGCSRREAVLLLHLMGMVGGTLGVIVARPEAGPRIYLPVALVGIAALVAIGAFLDRAPVYAPKESAPAPAAGAEEKP
jgi:UDP-GlcNAc:undecaprenyl-phosphate/decaprenyl-phosphate GlcNAc-1-phosphate transferase